MDRSDRPVFMLGANYEAADRAWQMWDDQLFDPMLIAQDLDRARAANLSVLRMFVQPPLAADIRAGRWAKLDRVLDLADRRGSASSSRSRTTGRPTSSSWRRSTRPWPRATG